MGAIAKKEDIFEAHIHDKGQMIIVPKRYSDISYVNYWIDKQKKRIYKVHMLNGEVLDIDNAGFNEKHCPHGVNIINEVTKKKYL